MRKNFLLLFFMAGMAVSCTNDCLPMFDDGCDWQTSLSEIAGDNKELFAGRGMELTGYCQMKDMKLDRELLCGREYGSFPVYSEKDSVFTVLTYDELRNDAEKYNYDMEKVDARIDSILSHADDYDIIQLEWTGCAGKFYTLALFNRLTAELEYDNMLYNMSTVARYDSQELSMMVSISETSLENKHIKTFSDSIKYYNEEGDFVAMAGINCKVYGRWDVHYYYLEEDQDSIYYLEVANFLLDRIVVTPQTRIEPESNGDVFVDYDDYSVSLQPRYAFDYVIWAGPAGKLELHNFTFPMQESDFLNSCCQGAGNVKLRYQEEYIYRPYVRRGFAKNRVIYYSN